MKFIAQIHVEIPDAMLAGLLQKAGVEFKGEADTIMGLTMMAAGGVSPALRALLLDPERTDSQYDTAYAVTTEDSAIQIAVSLGKPDAPLPTKKPASRTTKTTARKRKTPAKGGQPR